MKISKVATNHILLKAHCSNEYTDCETCLITIPEGTIEIWKERWSRIQDLVNNTEGFCSAEWLYDDIQFLKSDMSVLTDIEDHESADEYYYVDLEENGVIELIEEKVNGSSMYITSNGCIWFQGYGKYSGDEYSTEEIDIDKL